jgi:hypothetical protein
MSEHGDPLVVNVGDTRMFAQRRQMGPLSASRAAGAIVVLFIARRCALVFAVTASPVTDGPDFASLVSSFARLQWVILRRCMVASSIETTCAVSNLYALIKRSSTRPFQRTISPSTGRSPVVSAAAHHVHPSHPNHMITSQQDGTDVQILNLRSYDAP